MRDSDPDKKFYLFREKKVIFFKKYLFKIVFFAFSLKVSNFTNVIWLKWIKIEVD